MVLPDDRAKTFWSRVNKTDTCWLWIAGCTGAGYGAFRPVLGEKPDLTHRISYQMHIGPIPEGAFVLHTCDVPRCVRPDHLRVGTQAENIQDILHRGRRQDQKGATNNHAKLTDEDVREIRRLKALGGWTNRALGEKFDIAQSSISLIVNRKHWSHVE